MALFTALFQSLQHFHFTVGKVAGNKLGQEVLARFLTHAPLERSTMLVSAILLAIQVITMEAHCAGPTPASHLMEEELVHSLSVVQA